VLLWSKWRFTREHLTGSLERATGSKLRAARFRMTFFPSPGCVLAVRGGNHINRKTNEEWKQAAS
jgi:hypothetical protein